VALRNNLGYWRRLGFGYRGQIRRGIRILGRHEEPPKERTQKISTHFRSGELIPI